MFFLWAFLEASLKAFMLVREVLIRQPKEVSQLIMQEVSLFKEVGPYLMQAFTGAMQVVKQALWVEPI